MDMLDRHHQRMGRLCEALRNAGGAQAATNIFLGLATFADMNFRAEETLMRETDYPKKNLHLDRHHQIRRFFEEHQDRLVFQRGTVTPTLVKRVYSLVKTHLDVMDQEFDLFLQTCSGNKKKNGFLSDPGQSNDRSFFSEMPRRREASFSDPLHSLKTVWAWRRSTWANVSGAEGNTPWTTDGKSGTFTDSPSDKTTACSMTLWSSRTLPGHG